MPSNLLKKWLIRQVERPAYEWFVGQQRALLDDHSARNLHITLGMIPRRLGKGDLQLSIEDVEGADGKSLMEVAEVTNLAELKGLGQTQTGKLPYVNE